MSATLTYPGGATLATAHARGIAVRIEARNGAMYVYTRDTRRSTPLSPVGLRRYALFTSGPIEQLQPSGRFPDDQALALTWLGENIDAIATVEIARIDIEGHPPLIK